MYIGKLNSKASGLKGSYCFMQRGTPNPFPPDIIFGSHGEDKGKIAFGSGSLCSGNPVGWKWDSLMDVGLDIRIDLSKECFIGAVCIGLSGGSAVQKVEVFSENGRNLQCIGRFDAQTNGQLEGEFTVPIGVSAKILIVRFKANLKDIVISKLDVIGAIFDLPIIYPSPVSVKYSEKKIALDSIQSITTCDNSTDSDFAARYCKERLHERFGISLPIGKSGEKIISIGLCDDIRKEGYRITIDKDGVRLVASERLGLLYAVETLLQLTRAGEIPICEVEDYPYKSMRGIHFGLPPREEIGFARRLIRYVLIPMRYNTLFIEFAGGMRFDKHPEISEAWVQGNRAAKAGTQPKFPHGEMVAGGELLEKDEVRDFIEYARSYGFEIIPEVQSFGHVEYITYAHPEIAEVEEGSEDKKVDTRSADQPPSKFYHHSYCPSKEKSYEIIFDIIDEIVEVVKPERYVHMGHDEIYEIGLCPLCKGKDHSELYAKHVNRMHDYLEKKGLGMMIWSDMLQPTERYKTPPAVAKIPKDIVMLDFIWYFHFDIDMEDHILPHGFDVVIGNMYSSHYPRFESRIAKKGMLGGEVSTWCRFDEYNLAKKGKIFDLLYSAEMLWSDTYNSCARQVYTEIIQKMIPRIRDELRGIAKPEGTAITTVQITLPKPSRQLIPPAIKSIICNSSHCNSSQNINGYSFDLSNAQLLSNIPIEIKVADKFRRIVFLHTATNNTARIAWNPLTRIGEYIVKYSDNTEVVIPVEYAGNICVWTKRYAEPMPQQYYRHQGYIATYFSDPVIQAKTECGQDITLLGYEWVNPYPGREIHSISCSGNDATDAGILLLGLSGVR
jgi:hypothetical protein